MRALTLAACVLLVLPATVQAESTEVRISELLPDPDGGREFIELWNRMNHDVALGGWTIEDAAGTTFTFPAWSLPPDGRVVVWGGGESDGSGPAWNRASVWNNGGDTAILRDEAGRMVDSFTYGDEPPAPPPGRSLQWTDGWIEAAPTPGQSPGAVDGGMEVHVTNVPPVITIMDVPSALAPGETAHLGFHVRDDNGDAVQWTVLGPHGAINGTGAGNQSVAIVAPQSAADHTWILQASDGHGTAEESITIPVRVSPLELILPPGGIRFPELSPGAQDAVADGSWTLVNRGNTTITPRIDISPFRGPVELPVAGNLRLLFDDGSEVAYDGPLTPLPSLDSGGSMVVTVVLEAIPVPFPAGNYGTSFAVTA